MREEEIFVLLGLVLLAVPVLLIVFMIWVVKLSGRVRELENRLEKMSGRLDAPVLAAAPKAPAAAPEIAAEPAPTAEPQPSAPPEPKAEAATGPWNAGGTKTAPPEPEEPEAPAETPIPDAPIASADEASEAAAPIAIPTIADITPPKAVVLNADKANALGDWLKANWIYVISAVSLAFAGLFFVQYGIENGLLSPTARVISALVFGLALVVAGEVIRRRWGDREEVATAYLPSVFSGAGIVTLFGAVLAALHLYALIGPGTGLIGLIAVAALAIGLGWYSGPLLAAIGILGAFTAPFLVGGDSDTPQAFYAYFALIMLTGLAIDAARRWAWVSLLTLVLVYPATWMLYISAGYPEYATLLLLGTVIASIAIPPLKLMPTHGGAAIVESLSKTRARGWPEFPTRLAGGTMLASTIFLLMISTDGVSGFWLALGALTVLFVAISFWAESAEALEDLALLPALGLFALPVLQMLSYGAVYEPVVDFYLAPEGTPAPNAPYILIAITLFLSLAAALRAWRGGRWPVIWAAGAAFMAPAMVVALEFLWLVPAMLGTYAWAIVATLIAMVMTALAGAFARIDHDSHGRIAGFALAAIAMIAYALTLVLTETALTLALAVTTLAAAGLDRRFNLRPLSIAVQLGAIALGWRLILEPGIDWAMDAPYWELTLGFAGSIAALVATLRLLRPLHRPAALVVVESAVWTYGAIFASVLLFRVIDDLTPGRGTETHWFAGIFATLWLASAANQLWRTQIDGWTRKLRLVLTGLYLLLGALVLGIGLTFFNPAINGTRVNLVQGVILLNTLIPAYLLPALVFGFVAWRFRFLEQGLRIASGIVALALAAIWAFLAIRHGWRGDLMSNPGFTQPELYTYTIVLLLLGAGLLYQAIARRSAPLRKAAMAVIGLTVAKVFLVDISGLVGLLRVFSFLALGLVLAGLAFLNRWAAARIGQGADMTPDNLTETTDEKPEE